MLWRGCMPELTAREGSRVCKHMSAPSEGNMLPVALMARPFKFVCKPLATHRVERLLTPLVASVDTPQSWLHVHFDFRTTV